MTAMQLLELDRKYTLSMPNRDKKSCLYEGIAGDYHGFVTENVDGKNWKRINLREGEFNINNTNVEVIVVAPYSYIISIEDDYIEFHQIKAWWEKYAK